MKTMMSWKYGLLFLVAVALASYGCSRASRDRAGNTSAETEYKAVLLSNDQVFVGKLENLGSPFPVLTDVYYVRTVQDPNTKQTSNILVKRGKEWHAPDRTILNATHIVIVEPVTKGSRLMELINQDKAASR